MLTSVRNWLAFFVVGPLIGFGISALAVRGDVFVGPPSAFTVLAGVFLMFVAPILVARMAWWTFKVATKRWIEREVDLRFVSKHGRQIRDARARSW